MIGAVFLRRRRPTGAVSRVFGLSWAALILFCSCCLGLVLLAAASIRRCQLQT